MTATPAPAKRAPALLTEPVTLTLDGPDLAALNRFRQASYAYLWANGGAPVEPQAEEDRLRVEFEEAREALALVVSSRVVADRLEY